MNDKQIAEIVRVVREEVDARLAAKRTSLDSKAQAAQVFEAVQDYIRRCLDPLAARINALEEERKP